MDNTVILQQILVQLTRIGDALQAQQDDNVQNLLQATTRMGTTLKNLKRFTEETSETKPPQ